MACCKDCEPPAWFNLVVVEGTGVKAEAMITEGPYAVDGEHGRVAVRIEVPQAVTAGEAQLAADIFLGILKPSE